VPTSNTSFTDRHSTYLTLHIDTSLSTWEGALHGLIATLHKKAYEQLHQDTEWSCGASHSLDARDLLHWAVRGLAIERRELTERAPIGLPARFVGYSIRGVLEQRARVVEAHAGVDAVYRGMKAMEGRQDSMLKAVGGGWGGFQADCPDDWRRLAPGSDGDATLRQRVSEALKGAVGGLTEGAREHGAAAFDALVDWALDSVGKKQEERRAVFKRRGVVLPPRPQGHGRWSEA